MARFTTRKRYHDPIAKALQGAPELLEMARSIGNCAEALEVLLELPEGADPFAMLTDFNPCNRRACPTCEWRRSLVWRARLMQGLDGFFDANPTHRGVFATFTMRNVRIEHLGDGIKQLHRAWRLLTVQRWFPTSFWFRRTEVTVGRPAFYDSKDSPIPWRTAERDEPSDDPTAREQSLQPVWAHPHIHALLLVPASYFSHGYIKQGKWQQQWMMALGADYAPVVDIRTAKAKFTTGEAFYDAKAAGIEAMKYAVKATDMLKLAVNLPEFIHQMRGHRLVGMSKGLRAFVPDHDPEAKEMADDRAAGLPRLHPGVTCLAQWDRSLSDYVLTPR
jgi:hypothetical protein